MNQLDLIEQYFDISKVLLHREDKELLSRILENRDICDGYVSEVYVECVKSNDRLDPWVSEAYHQYKIVFDGPNQMRIDSIHKHVCGSGYVDETHWTWDNACSSGYDVRAVLECLKLIAWEL